MKFPRRSFLHLAASLAAFSAIARITRAQAYPARSVRVIVPFARGGPTDVCARLIAQKLSEQLGRQHQGAVRRIAKRASCVSVRHVYRTANCRAAELGRPGIQSSPLSRGTGAACGC
jgi:hypothetical protein